MRRTRAFTLVEVVASLALLGSAVTALLVAQGRLLERAKNTERSAEATQLARELVAQWKLNPPETGDGWGNFESNPDWQWRRSSRPWPLARHLAIDEVTLIVAARKDDNPQLTLTWLERRDDASR